MIINQDDFAVFILSHGRPNNVITARTLERCGYSGKWYIVVDNEDATISEYQKLYGNDRVIVFDKFHTSKTFDTFDLSDNRKTIVYARNECFSIAQQLGLKYFLELDDDYCRFEYRYVDNDKLMTQLITNLDGVIECMLNFLEDTNAYSVAFAQGGDLIGGKDGSKFKQKVLRKAMNSFFCRVDKPFKFVGRINEDVNTYTTLGSRGDLFFTITSLDLVQIPTQLNSGGMSDVYLDLGTYTKSFYAVMSSPSSVSIDMRGTAHKRVHHSVNWNACCPKIISDRFKVR